MWRDSHTVSLHIGSHTFGSRQNGLVNAYIAVFSAGFCSILLDINGEVRCFYAFEESWQRYYWSPRASPRPPLPPSHLGTGWRSRHPWVSTTGTPRTAGPSSTRRWSRGSP